MREFFVTLLLASVCASMLNLLSDGYEKQFRFVASAVCVAIVLIPLSRIELGDISFEEYTETESEGENGFYLLTLELTEERSEEYICEIVFSRFGIKPISADINIDWTSAEPIIKDISVTLKKGDNITAEVGEYLKTTLGGEVKIYEE